MPRPPDPAHSRIVCIGHTPVRAGRLGQHPDAIPHPNVPVQLQGNFCQQKHTVGFAINIDGQSHLVAVIGADRLALGHDCSCLHPAVAVALILTGDEGLLKMVESNAHNKTFFLFIWEPDFALPLLVAPHLAAVFSNRESSLL